MVNENLKINFFIIKKWFYENHMVLNPEKCHYLVLEKRSNSDTINLNGTKLASGTYEKLNGILIDRDLSSDKHIKSLCRKAGQKLNALARIRNYLAHDQKRLLLNSIIKSQFSYCPLIWMFCSRSLNNLINRIHERALRLIHNDHVSSFENILEMTKEEKIHQNNLESLAKEIYKFLNGLSFSIMHDAFMIRNNKCNLRNFQCLYSTNRRIAKYGAETVTYRGSQMWNLVPEKTKNASSLEIFKNEIRKRKGEKCPCTICKTYIQHVGLISKNCRHPVNFLYIFIYIFIVLFMGDGGLISA